MSYEDDDEVLVPVPDFLRSSPLDRTHIPAIDPRLVVIDWISASWPVSVPDLVHGNVTEVWRDDNRLIRRRICATWKEHPSWSSKVQIRVVGGYCEVSGNLNKWLHGQALHGISDPIQLIRAWLRPQVNEIGYDIFPRTPFEVRMSRIDLTAHYNVETVERADLLLNALRYVLRARLPGETMPGLVKEYRNTVYWGQHSRGWTLKVYNKLRELRRHWAKGNETLENWDVPESVLRWELTLRGPELLHHWANLHSVPSSNFYLGGWAKWAWPKTLACAGNWTPEKGLGIWMKYIKNRIQAFDNKVLPPADMPFKDLLLLRAWENFDPIKENYSRMAYYVIRKRFKEKYNIDLQRPPNPESAGTQDNIVSQCLKDLRAGRLYSFRSKQQQEEVA